MLKVLFLTIFVGLSIHVPKASSTEAVFHIQYTKEYDTLDEIANRYFSLVKKRYKNQIVLYKKDLIRWNPHITNWKNLTNRRAIYVDTPNDSEKKYDAINRRWSFFAFYSAHFGTFDEKLEDQSIKSTQASPIALGLTSYYNLRERRHAIVTNAYLSYLSGSKISGTVSNADQNIKIPPELGLSLYYQYSPSYSFPTLYGGVDRETFTSFNTTELLQGDALETRANVLFFYTAGFIKSFDVKRNSVTVRASYAKSFQSSTSATDSTKTFEGSRIHFYLSIKGAHNLSYNFLYKRFDLSGPTELVVNRVGIGIGYQFY